MIRDTCSPCGLGEVLEREQRARNKMCEAIHRNVTVYGLMGNVHQKRSS